jgi:hypothetical protein
MRLMKFGSMRRTFTPKFICKYCNWTKKAGWHDMFEATLAGRENNVKHC